MKQNHIISLEELLLFIDVNIHVDVTEQHNLEKQQTHHATKPKRKQKTKSTKCLFV